MLSWTRNSRLNCSILFKSQCCRLLFLKGTRQNLSDVYGNHDLIWRLLTSFHVLCGLVNRLTTTFWTIHISYTLKLVDQSNPNIGIHIPYSFTTLVWLNEKKNNPRKAIYIFQYIFQCNYFDVENRFYIKLRGYSLRN